MFEIGSLLCGLAPNMVRYYIFSLTLVVSFSQKNNNPSLFIIYASANFMVVDCGGGTIDLTTRKLLDKNQLGEITERAGGNCGSAFIDN